jgi:hypothetical protein
MSNNKAKARPTEGNGERIDNPKLDYLLAGGLFIFVLLVSSIPIIFSPAEKRSLLIEEHFASHVLLALLSGLVFFVILRVTPLKHTIDRVMGNLSEFESKTQELVIEIKKTKQTIEKASGEAEAALLNVYEIANVWKDLQTDQQRSIHSTVITRTKVVAKEWISLISQWKDEAGATTKRGEIERDFWMTVFNKYMTEEYKDISTGSPTLVTNYSAYLDSLRDFAQLGPRLLRGKIACFQAVTNVLPVNWYNWKYTDGEYYNEHLHLYRKAVKRIIKDQEEEQGARIEFTRIFLVDNSSDYGIPPETDLRDQMNLYVGWINATDKPVEAPSDKGTIADMAGPLGITDYKQIPEGKLGYFIWSGHRPAERHVPIGGKSFYLNDVEKLGKRIINDLHSQPMEDNARYARVTSGDLASLPRGVTDFLIVGSKDSEDETDIKPIIGISCKLSLQPTSDMINLNVFGGTELRVLGDFVKKVREQSQPLSELVD